eukprot:1476_1
MSSAGTNKRRRSRRKRAKRNKNDSKNQNKNKKNKELTFDVQQCIGDTLDVLDGKHKWYRGTIEQITGSYITIKIRFPASISHIGYPIFDTKHIRMKKNKLLIHRIKPLYTKTIKVSNTYQLQLPIKSAIQKILYYNINYFIICSSNGYNNDYIYLYNILRNTIDKKYKFPSFVPHSADFGIALCKRTNSLFIIESNYPTMNEFYVLNLNSEQWSTIHLKHSIAPRSQRDQHISSVCIINECLYILSNRLLTKYCTKTGTLLQQIRIFVPKDENVSDYDKYKHDKNIMLYLNHHNKLFAFTNYWSKIEKDPRDYYSSSNKPNIQCWFSNLSKRKQHLKWKKMNALFPDKELQWTQDDLCIRQENIFYGFKNLIFILNLCLNKIVCYDMITNGWYFKRNEIVYPQDFHYMNCIAVSTGHNIHFFNKGKDNGHFVIALYDLIPDKLYGIHRKYYRKLIKGFMRQKIEKEYAIFVTNDIQNLIVQLFPLFANN